MERDLACCDIWDESLARSRKRRELARRRTPVSSRRGAVVAASVAAGATPATLAVSSVAAAAGSALSNGAHGSLVSAVQRRLHIGADGAFGNATESAVRDFQSAHGLTVDGVIGPATLRALHLSGARASAAGGGGGVRALQHALGVGADGVFGPGTESAVRDYQSNHGLTADGVAGPATRAALGLGPGPTLRRGARGSAHRRSGPPGAVRAAIAAADRIATTPYEWGGGHGSFSSTGYDCSGSVSYVLHGAGVLSTPEDSSQLSSYGVPGRGRWITIYATSGHAFMTIGHRRFDTSARSETGSRWSGDMRGGGGYVARHPAGL